VSKVGEGPAASAGIREGDVITMIDSTTVTSLEEFEEAVKSITSGASVAVLVQRQQGPVFLAMTIE